MSVIVGRALPDAPTGSSPCTPRALRHARPRAAAEPAVPEVRLHRRRGEGKYHLHGDWAIYDTLARMAQDFSMRYPLIDGRATSDRSTTIRLAAMRYTEAPCPPRD